MRRLLRILPSFIISTAFSAEPKTDTNVVATAEDAFGITLGPESLGLYSPSGVRGFNPITAGNARIDGLYFDQQGSMFDRLVTDTRIRVGLSSVTFPWPAPSGIVDYTLRQPKEVPALSTISYVGPYDSRDFDIDGYTNILRNKLGLAAGASYHSDEYIPGEREHIGSVAILPKWTPRLNISINAFWGRMNVTGTRPQPVIYLNEGQTPPPVPTRYFGMPWAELDYYSEDYGILTKIQLSSHWSVRAGVFRSNNGSSINNSELYLNTSSQGVGDHILIAEPNQYYGSTSGEIQLSHVMEKQDWRQAVIFGARGRSKNALYGGAEAIDFGLGLIDHPKLIARPSYTFGPTTSDHIREHSIGASYSLRWKEYLNLTSDIRRDNYLNKVSDPAGGNSIISADPWLYNASLALVPTTNFEIFAALTRGLEDSGVAPSSAINRGQVLNATRSSQEEVGIKYSITPSLTVLAGAFDINRSYFGLTEQGLFDQLGQERHRGMEFSLTGQVAPGLHLVAGVSLMSPDVLAAHSALTIGIRPVGQASRTEQLALDYQAPWFPPLSVDCVLSSLGSREANIENNVKIPAYSTLDMGARYHINIGQRSATLRLQVLNVTNTLNWFVQNDGGLQSLSPRRVWAYVIVDL